MRVKYGKVHCFSGLSHVFHIITSNLEFGSTYMQLSLIGQTGDRMLPAQWEDYDASLRRSVAIK